MKCANCNKPAMFEYRITQTQSLFYCGSDLPKFLEERRKAGLLTLTDANKDAEKSAVKTLEFIPSEKPVTKKKSSKKSEK